MASYVEKAVDALHAAYVARIDAQLALVETEAGIVAGSLTTPLAILNHRAIRDNRSPVIQIYDTGIGATSQRNNVWSVPCDLVFIHTGGTDLEANELFARRYLTALINVVQADETLGGEAYNCNYLGGDAARQEGDSSQIRYLYGIAWDVRLYSPPL